MKISGQKLRMVKVTVLDCDGLFKDYELHKVEALSLKYWLSKVVMEVAKKSGEIYPPKTVYDIKCSPNVIIGGEKCCCLTVTK